MEQFARPRTKFVPHSSCNEADGRARLPNSAPEGSCLRGKPGCQVRLAIRFTCLLLSGSACTERVPFAFLLLPLDGGCQKGGNHV